jgi:hypothetical protein
MKMAGCNTEEEFYQKYPSEKDFFAAYPHMKGNQTMKMGGAASGHSGSYWNGDQWVSSAGDSGTYANGVYYATGGPVFMPGGSAPIFGMGGAASFNISNNEYPTPFAMAPGTGRGGGYLQDLPTHMAHGGPIPGAEIVDPFAMYPGSGKGSGMLEQYANQIMQKGGQTNPYAVSDVRYPEQVNNQAPINETQMGRYRRMVDPNKVNQFHQSLYNTNSASDFFGAVPDIHEPYFGEPATPISKKDNFEYRKGLAERQYGISNYRGTAAQNMELLNRGKRTLNDQWGDWEGHSKDDELISIRQYGGVHPFAMYPGTGKGGGMLQDLPVEMKKGGIHIAPSKRGTFTAAATKHGKSVQAFASQVLANKENYSPAMVKKANFARNAAKWKHEYGGFYEDGGSTMPDNPGFRALPPAVQQKIMDNMQTGGMVTADRVVYGPGGQYMEQGGMINPYHPMAKFMRGGYYANGGYYVDGGPYTVGQYVEGKGYWDGATFVPSPPGVTSDQISPEGSQAVTLNAPSSTTPVDAFKPNSVYDTTVYNPTTDPNNPVNNPPPMPKQGGYAASQGAVYEGKMDNKTTEQAPPKYNWFKAGSDLLGNAVALATTYSAKRNAANDEDRRRRRNLDLATVDMQGKYGDNTQQGDFRLNERVPTRAGLYYSGIGGFPNSGISKYGGMHSFAKGGYYAGQEIEVSDADIENLKRMGYKFDII